jgi:hypothetical protein
MDEIGCTDFVDIRVEAVIVTADFPGEEIPGSIGSIGSNGSIGCFEASSAPL